MNKILKNSIIILALITFAAGMPAFAQLNPYTGVGGYDPGVIDQTNLMQIRDYELKSKSDREREAKEKEQIEMQKKLLDEEMNKLPNKEVSFILNSVSFKGNTVFTDDELMHLICDKVGTEVTINELITFCNLITDYYQQRGYISSIAYLPPKESRRKH
jgi:hemolysin activation/secretion protein